MGRVLEIFVFCALCAGSVLSDKAFFKSPTARCAVWKYFLTSWEGYENMVISETCDQLNCGGQKITRGQIDGKCGVCGDPYNGERKNERPGGVFAYNRPTMVYREGAVINVTVSVTERSAEGGGGHFIFKLCDRDHDQTQECFNKNVLTMAGTSTTYIPVPPVSGDVVIPVKLPGVTCDFCTLQFIYVSANTLRCEAVGPKKCTYGEGEEETIVNCADVRIIGKSSPIPSDFLWPDYNSEYSALHGAATTTEEPPKTTTGKFIIITPDPGTGTGTGTTTTETPPTTAEKLIVVPPVVLPPVVAGGGAALAGGEALAASLGGFGPLALLFGLGLLGQLGQGRSVGPAPVQGPFSVPVPYSPTSYVVVPVPPRDTLTGPAPPVVSTLQGSPFSPGVLLANQQQQRQQQGTGGPQLIGEGWGVMEVTQPQWIDVDLNRPGTNGFIQGQGTDSTVNRERWFPEQSSGRTNLPAGGLAPAGNQNGVSTQGLNSGSPFSGLPAQQWNNGFQVRQPIQSIPSIRGQPSLTNSPLSFQQNQGSVNNVMNSGMPGNNANMMGGNPAFNNGWPTNNGLGNGGGQFNNGGGQFGNGGGQFRNGGGRFGNGGGQFGNSGQPAQVPFNGLPSSISDIDHRHTYVQGNGGFFELPNNHNANGVPGTNQIRPTPLPLQTQNLLQDITNSQVANDNRLDTNIMVPSNIGAPGRLLEFDREPGVIAERKRAFSSQCFPKDQTCKPRYGKAPTLYNDISIFGLICDLECSNGNPNCPAEICSCSCPPMDMESIMSEIQSILKHRHHKQNMERSRVAAAILKKALQDKVAKTGSGSGGG